MYITDATKQAILTDLLNPTKMLEDVIRTYREVCDEAIIHGVGTEAGIDWDLRIRLQDTLIKKDQLDALVVEMESTFFEKVKHPNDEEDLRPVRYNSYRRTRRFP